MARSKQVDEYMEQKFGKPRWKKSFRQGDQLLTPMERQPKLWRVDPLPRSRR